jgi:predicted AAA+ superfamily ATPase
LAESFTLLIIYYWGINGGFEPRKQRKVYFVDPLFAQVPSAALGVPNRTPADGMLEGAIATGLFRAASEHMTQSDPTIGSLGYWRSADGREIDFVTQTDDTSGDKTLPVEVKGDSRSGINGAIASIQRSFRRGIVATRTQFEVQDQILVVPAAILLAGLIERTERRLSTL